MQQVQPKTSPADISYLTATALGQPSAFQLDHRHMQRLTGRIPVTQQTVVLTAKIYYSDVLRIYSWALAGVAQ